MNRFFAAAILLIAANSATAATITSADGYELKPLLTDSSLAISAELGALFYTGNNESTSILGSITSEYELAKWRHKNVFEFLYKQDEVTNFETSTTDVETTAEKYLISAEAFYSLTERDFVFAYVSSEHDRFGAYKKYTSLGGGYSKRLIEGSLVLFDVNTGLGYTFSETKEGLTEDAPSFRVEGVFEWVISNSAKFIQNFSLETSEINTRAVSESYLTAKVHGSMQMKVGYKVISNDQVEDGLEKVDTEMSVTVVVNF